MKTIGVGMVGTGFMARTHSLAYSALPYYTWPLKLKPRKVMIASSTKLNADEGAARFGFEQSTGDWQESIEPGCGYCGHCSA